RATVPRDSQATAGWRSWQAARGRRCAPPAARPRPGAGRRPRGAAAVGAGAPAMPSPAGSRRRRRRRAPARSRTRRSCGTPQQAERTGTDALVAVVTEHALGGGEHAVAQALAANGDGIARDPAGEGVIGDAGRHRHPRDRAAGIAPDAPYAWL